MGEMGEMLGAGPIRAVDLQDLLRLANQERVWQVNISKAGG